MGTDAEETSTAGERDESTDSGKPDLGNDEKSQEEMAEDARQVTKKRKAESKQKAGSVILISSVVLGVIALICLYLGQSVTGNHPLAVEAMNVLGVLNLVLALAVYVRKNWPRTLILLAMPVTILGTALCLPLIGQAKYLVFVLCLVEIYLMFRQPILDEFDAPEE